MAKRFKLRFSLPSLQFCRSKRSSMLPHSPLPATFMFFPVNPKAFDITYPSFPDAPPSTPKSPNDHHPLFQPRAPSKTTPVSGSKEFNKKEHDGKMYKSPASDEFDASLWPVIPPKGEKKKNKKTKDKPTKKKSQASVCTSISSAESGWSFTSEGGDEEETESLVSSSRSFDSSYDFGYSLGTISESSINGGRRKKKHNLKVRRLGRYASNTWKNGEKTTTTAAPPENESPVKKSVFRRLISPCSAEGKVNESFAVVKKSEDPYEDFKRSMLEMILEKEMFEAKDLEELLQCFLSLNSSNHHAVIVEAFAEIWEVLFSKSPKSSSASIGF
ncbi:unnamed protein product [Ilex paraguariensis]|uniref:Transcription repressor n=1 Tax=Ilex paraguariensis TaxID=185542 RepID=A0ABC8UDP6_9AQUA